MSPSGTKRVGSPETVAVIGAGLMGHGIAQAFAQGGSNVTLHDTDQTILKQARERIRLNLKALADKGLEAEGRIDEIVSRISSTARPGRSGARCGLCRGIGHGRSAH